MLIVPADMAAQPVLSALHRTGPDARRINIVIVAEGYTEAEAAKFSADARLVANAILQTDPYDDYQTYFNVHSVFVASAESGTNQPLNPHVDTYFQAYLACGGAPQGLCLTPEGDERLRDLLAATVPHFDLPVVLVNISGSAGGAGLWAVTASAEPTGQLAVHELGHLFAGLADEYEAAQGNTIPTRTSPNVTTATVRGRIPWSRHIEDETPIPTPQTAEFAEHVGLFAASTQSDLGWFRPQQFCKMRSSSHDFCIVCREAHVRAIHRAIDPVEAFAPVTAEVDALTGQMLRFDLDVLHPANHALQISWSVNGQPVPGARSDSLLLLVGRLLPQTFEVSAQLSDPAPVASGALRHAQRWTVTRSDYADAPLATTFDGASLGQNFPNPVADITTIDFVLDRPSFVTLRVHDVAGRVVATLVSAARPAGLHEATWDTRGAARGIYLYTLSTSDGTETRKLVVK